MRVYLDSCCLNRLTDDQKQLRIRDEAEAVVLILRRIQFREIDWVSSEPLVDEIQRNPSLDRKTAISALLVLASETVKLDDEMVARAVQLQASGYGVYDALHLACAEAAQVDVFLTTDDKLIRRSDRNFGQVRLSVVNPLSWVRGAQS